MPEILGYVFYIYVNNVKSKISDVLCSSKLEPTELYVGSKIFFLVLNWFSYVEFRLCSSVWKAAWNRKSLMVSAPQNGNVLSSILGLENSLLDCRSYVFGHAFDFLLTWFTLVCKDREAMLLNGQSQKLLIRAVVLFRPARVEKTLVVVAVDNSRWLRAREYKVTHTHTYTRTYTSHFWSLLIPLFFGF